MDSKTLQKLVENALNGSSFALDLSALDSSAVTTLFQGFFQGTTLELSQASVSTSSGLVAAGSLASTLLEDFSFLAGMQATASFALDKQGTATLSLVLQPSAKDWGLADAVPGFSNSFLGAFSWSNATFAFDSETPASLPDGFPGQFGLAPYSSEATDALRQGMVFSADVSLATPDANLSWLLGADTVQVSGAIAWNGDQPSMDLSSEVLTTLDLEGFQLPISLHLVAVELSASSGGGSVDANPDPVPLSIPSVPFGAVCGDLERDIGSDQTLTIPFHVLLMGSPVQTVQVIGDFQEASSLGLQEVAALLGAKSLSSQQGSDFPTLAGLSLQTVELVVDTTNQQLVSAAATVQFAPENSWQPFGDLFTFDALDVTFALIGPLSTPSFETSIATTATLAGGQLSASILLPSRDFTLSLADGSPPIDLTAIVSEMTGGALGSSLTISVPELLVLASPSQNQYRFQATIQDDWQFSVDSKHSFSLTQVGFDLTRQADTTTGQVVAQLALGSKDDPVAVQISADYEGADAGWSFAGGTMGTQSIPLTVLIDDALQLFGLKLPDNAPQITVTDLQLNLQTKTMDFGFSLEAEMTMLGQDIVIGVDLGRTSDGSNGGGSKAADGTTTVFTGFLSLGGATFEVDFTSGDQSKELTASWSEDENESLSIDQLLTDLGLSLPQGMAKNPALQFTLSSASFTYKSQSNEFLLTATSPTYGTVLLAIGQDQKAQSGFLFGLAATLDASISLSDIPVVGKLVPSGEALTIDTLTLQGATSAVPVVDLTPDQQKLFSQPLSSGLSIALSVQIGQGDVQTLSVRFGDPSNSETPPDPGFGGGSGTQAGGTANRPSPLAFAAQGDEAQGNDPSATRPQGPNGVWLDVQRTFGPVQIQRVGFSFTSDAKLALLLDASVTLAGLTVGLTGLEAELPIEAPFVPSFSLAGLQVAYAAGPLTISGGLAKTEVDGNTEYDGDLAVVAAQFGLTALGSYTTVDGKPSLFAFLFLDVPLGGPPYFFVTGLAGGFGYNRTLQLPTIDQVGTYPLVAGARGELAKDDVLAKLTTLIAVDEGENWLAAGIRFTSFEMLDSFALLTVSFGTQLEIGLLGSSKLTLPVSTQDNPLDPVAQAELDLLVDIVPDQGVVAVNAQLTPQSYVLSKQAQLTGGFAFYLWFGSNPHAGDFVVTLGGYNPYFTPPSYYPSVPELGLNWRLSDTMSIKGGLYFALTPSAIMTGGGLQATWSSGSIQAWFDAQADFLIRYKPFAYLVQVQVNIGVSYTAKVAFVSKKLTAHVGVGLVLWGPSFGGQAHIDLSLISFTLSFGAKQSDAEPKIQWTEFKESFLPPSSTSNQNAQWTSARRAAAAKGSNGTPTDSVITIQIPSGLIKTVQHDETTFWVVDPGRLVVTVNTSVPTKTASVTPASKPTPTGDWNQNFGIGPMNISPDDLDVTTSIQIAPLTVTGPGERSLRSATPSDDSTPQWSASALCSDVPKGLWLKSDAKLETDAVVQNALSGVQLSPEPLPRAQTVPVSRDLLLFSSDEPDQSFAWSNPSIATSDSFPQSESIEEISSTLDQSKVAKQRSSILAALRGQGLDVPAQVSVSDFAAHAADWLLAEPQLRVLGEEPSA